MFRPKQPKRTPMYLDGRVSFGVPIFDPGPLLEPLLEPLFAWLLPGNRIIPGFLQWCLRGFRPSSWSGFSIAVEPWLQVGVNDYAVTTWPDGSCACVRSLPLPGQRSIEEPTLGLPHLCCFLFVCVCFRSVGFLCVFVFVGESVNRRWSLVLTLCKCPLGPPFWLKWALPFFLGI